MIHFLPFSHWEAAADLDTGDLFIAQRLWDQPQLLLDNLAHEIAHLVVGHGRHDYRWTRTYLHLGGQTLPSAFLNTAAPLCLNIGNISGVQNMLLDYHLLQAYRKFSQKILGTEGHWEVLNEGTSTVEGDALSAKDQLIRLYPTPKGAFPVVVLYIPIVDHFRSPQARRLAYEMMLAEAKSALGHARAKLTGLPTPDGGSINYDGSELIQAAEQAKEKIILEAINLGEPLGPLMW